MKSKQKKKSVTATTKKGKPPTLPTDKFIKQIEDAKLAVHAAKDELKKARKKLKEAKQSAKKDQKRLKSLKKPNIGKAKKTPEKAQKKAVKKAPLAKSLPKSPSTEA